jgi:hypothetical protein
MTKCYCQVSLLKQILCNADAHAINLELNQVNKQIKEKQGTNDMFEIEVMHIQMLLLLIVT